MFKCDKSTTCNANRSLFLSQNKGVCQIRVTNKENQGILYKCCRKFDPSLLFNSLSHADFRLKLLLRADIRMKFLLFLLYVDIPGMKFLLFLLYVDIPGMKFLLLLLSVDIPGMKFLLHADIQCLRALACWHFGNAEISFAMLAFEHKFFCMLTFEWKFLNIQPRTQCVFRPKWETGIPVSRKHTCMKNEVAG